MKAIWRKKVDAALFALSRKAGINEAKRVLWSYPAYHLIRTLIFRKETANSEYIRNVENIHKRYDKIKARYTPLKKTCK